MTAGFRKVQVKKNQVGTGRGVCVDLIEVFRGRVSVADDIDIGIEAAGADRLPNQEDIGLAVFNDQDPRFTGWSLRRGD